MRVTLDVERFSTAVERDHAAAVRLGIHGTPGIIIGTGERAIFLLGAHSYAELSDAIASY